MTQCHRFAFTLIYWLWETVGEGSGCLPAPGKSSTFGYEEAPEGEKQTRKSTVAVVCIILHTLNGVVITHTEDVCEGARYTCCLLK